jgi:hypothetical protein
MSAQKKEFREFEKNMKWFQKNYERLRELYSGQYVAVKDDAVVKANEDVRVLIKELREEHKDLGAFVVEYVSKEKIELIL